MAPGYIRLKLNVLRPPNHPSGRSVGLPSKESGVQTETDTGGIRETASLINRHSPPQYTERSFGFSRNDRDNRRSGVRITKVQSRVVTPASGTFTRSALRDQNTFGLPSTKHYSPPQKEENGNSVYFPQTWDSRYTKKSEHDENILTTDSSKADENKSSSKSFLFPSQTNRLQRVQPLTSRGRYSDYKETNWLPVVEAERELNGKSNALVFRSDAALHGASIGNKIPTFPSQEKQTPAVDFSQNQLPVSNKEMLGHRKILSYLFKDSPGWFNTVTSDKQGEVKMDAAKRKESPFDTQEKTRFGFDFKRLTTIQPVEQDTGGHKEFRGGQIRKYLPQHTTTSPANQPASVEGKNLQSLVPTVPLHSQDGYATSSKTFVSMDRVNSSSRELKHNYKSEQSIKRTSRLGGFTNSVKPPGSSPSKKPHFQQSILDKGVKHPFRFTNMYPYLFPKYSFEQKGASAPVKPERTDSSSPALSIQIPSVSTARPFTTTLRHPPPKRVTDVNKTATEKQFKLYKGRFGLKGFGAQPLEGAKALPEEPSPSTKTGFKGFQLNNLQTWEPKSVRIHRRYNQAGDAEPGSRKVIPVDPNGRVKVKDELKPVPRTPKVPVLKPDGQSNLIRNFQLLLRPVTNQTAWVQSKKNWTQADKNSIWASKVVSSSYLRSAGRLMMPPRLESKSSKDKVNKSVATANHMTMFKTPTSGIVRGIRVKQASRKLDGYTTINATRHIATITGLEGKAITYADIIGSASFSSIAAVSQPPVTSTDMDYFPNVTTTEENPEWTLKSDNEGNTTTSLEANQETFQEDFISVKKNLSRKDKVEMSDLFFDGEGSGSRDLDLSEVSSTESQTAGRNLLELDYLQKSTRNIFFKSMANSYLDQP